MIKEYGYDVNNLRIWEKNRHGQITHYVFDHKGNRIERHTDEKSEYYIFRNLHHIAKRVVDHSTNTEKTYFYGTDHLGSTVLMTDEDGNEVFSAETTPFGDSVSESGAMADTENLMYTGKDLDEDTGLYYFNARWYDPTVGRFISEDPARFGANWYRYAASNPLKYFDPTGLNEVSWDTTIFDAGDYHTDTPENENYENVEETTTEVATYEEITEQINHVSTGISAQETITQQSEKLVELSQQNTSEMTLDEFLSHQQEMQDLAKELLQGILDYRAAGYNSSNSDENENSQNNQNIDIDSRGFIISFGFTGFIGAGGGSSISGGINFGIDFNNGDVLMNFSAAPSAGLLVGASGFAGGYLAITPMETDPDVLAGNFLQIGLSAGEGKGMGIDIALPFQQGVNPTLTGSYGATIKFPIPGEFHIYGGQTTVTDSIKIFDFRPFRK